MKSTYTIWVFLLVWLPFCMYGKPDSLRQRIGVIGIVPILIESGHSIFDWQEDSLFKVSPGRIRISVLPRGRAFNFDHLLQKTNQKPLPLDRAKQIKLLYRFADKLDQTWLTAAHPENDSTHETVEINLNPGDNLLIAWREQEQTTAHVYLCFQVTERAPEIIGYRLYSFYDSSQRPGQLEKRILQRFNDQTGYQNLENNSLRIPPSTIPEFRIRGYKLLTGEVISYRLTDLDNASINGDWYQTDHILALPNLAGDKSYQLELKFPGQSVTSKYTLLVALHWYEKTWVKLTALILLIALTILLTGWFYRRKLAKEKDNRSRVEEQLRTLQSRLNPHFIFNALSSIEGLVSSGQNKEANHYLSMFSDILRQTLEHSGELSISLAQDMALLDCYLRIEQLRFGFRYTITVDPSIEAATLEVPPMLMQPLVENAVKHGVAEMGAGGIVEILVNADHPHLHILITDNGNGQAAGMNTAGGHGLRFTRERLGKYAKLHPMQPIEFSIDLTQSGTQVKLFYRNLLA